MGENLEARTTYVLLLAGMAFNNANLGYVHAMKFLPIRWII